MKKTLIGLVALVAGCATAPPRAPVITPPTATEHTVTVHVCEGPCSADHKSVGARVTAAAIDTRADGAGNVSIVLPRLDVEVCAEADGYASTCGTVSADRGDLNLELARLVSPILPLTVGGKIFRAGGQPWRWKGVTAFGLLERFARGEDISDFLTAYHGYNLLRVWPYVPVKDWGARAWNVPGQDTITAFLGRVARDGFYVELTLLTDDEPGRVDQARQLVEVLVAARPPNLVIEIGNEPTTHKAIDTASLRGVLDASGFLYSSGDYEDSSRWFGRFLTAHTGRDGEWPRRAHDLLDYYVGGGPNLPTEPAHRVPIVSDEPIRPDQAGYVADDFRAYFAACALLGAGATFHSETGKYGLPPTPDEARMAAVALEALNAFPADAPLGAYRRIDGGALRTYVVGERYMVRIRPTSPAAPEPGWRAIDAGGVLWQR